MLAAGRHSEIAARAVAIERAPISVFSFEKMALRDAVKSARARAFAQGLCEFLHGSGDMETRFNRWCDVVAGLPRKGTRVLTWPVVTVVGFITHPQASHLLKPTVTREAARPYGIPFHYQSRPSMGDLCQPARAGARRSANT